MQTMALIFTAAGSADYGTFGRWLLLTLTVICWGAQYASVSLTGMYLFSPVSSFSLSGTLHVTRALQMECCYGTLHGQLYHLRC